jgi:hypothetical protein
VGRVLWEGKRIKQTSPPFSCFLIFSSTHSSPRHRVNNNYLLAQSLLHTRLNMSGKTTSKSSVSSSSGGSASPGSPLSPFSSPRMEYFEEPQNEPSSPSERQYKWSSLPSVRTSSKPTKHRSSSSADETPSPRSPLSPKPNRSRNSGTFSDVGRHSNEWLFGGYGARELVNSFISSNK